MAMSFNFILLNNSKNGLFSSSESENETSLLSDNTAQYSSILSTVICGNDCTDAFGGKDMFGTCDLSNMNETLFTYDSSEVAGSIAFDSSEVAGSVACAVGGSDSGVCSASFSSVC